MHTHLCIPNTLPFESGNFKKKLSSTKLPFLLNLNPTVSYKIRSYTESIKKCLVDYYNLFYFRKKFDLHMTITVYLVCKGSEDIENLPHVSCPSTSM